MNWHLLKSLIKSGLISNNLYVHKQKVSVFHVYFELPFI